MAGPDQPYRPDRKLSRAIRQSPEYVEAWDIGRLDKMDGGNRLLTRMAKNEVPFHQAVVQLMLDLEDGKNVHRYVRNCRKNPGRAPEDDDFG